MDKTFKDKDELVDDLINKGIVIADKRKLMETILQGVYVKGINDGFKHIEDGLGVLNKNS